jgi:hypothetical protein
VLNKKKMSGNRCPTSDFYRLATTTTTTPPTTKRMMFCHNKANIFTRHRADVRVSNSEQNRREGSLKTRNPHNGGGGGGDDIVRLGTPGSRSRNKQVPTLRAYFHDMATQQKIAATALSQEDSSSTLATWSVASFY